MKRGEDASCMVQPAYYIHYDKDLRKKYPDISEDAILYLDINLELVDAINDVFKDS